MAEPQHTTSAGTTAAHRQGVPQPSQQQQQQHRQNQSTSPAKHYQDDHDDHDDHDDDDHESSHGDGPGGDGQQPARKRQRVRLSCLECRRRKLSCSRDLPCDRCVKSGTPDRCTYETRPGAGPGPLERASFQPAAPLVSFDGADLRRTSSGLLRQDPVVNAARDHDRIRKLELEVAQLKGALAKQGSIDGSTVVASPAALKEMGVATSKDPPPEPAADRAGQAADAERGDGLNLTYIRGHNFKTRYFGPHNAWSSVMQLTGITPFMKETADQWLRPLRIQVKDRKLRKQMREKQALEPDLELEAQLPPKEETDALVSIYIDQYEQLHRIIHIPTFRNEYSTFWDPSRTRVASFTALVLAMIAVSSCLNMQPSNKFVGVKSSSFQTAERWIQHCETWSDQQSHKHRKLIHYQIACMLYLAKRVNVVKKKRFWTNSGAMIRDGIIVGLHQDPDHVSKRITPYYREMRRRLWATMIEFDVQASFDQGVPTLMSQIYNDAEAPLNINDDEFDEDCVALPASHPASQYTLSAYQHFSRQSLELRLELTKILTGPIANLDWEQVQKYIELIAQEIDALPSWDLGLDSGASPADAPPASPLSERSPKPILAHSLLHLQLRQYLIPLCQPYLKLRKYNSKYQTAEFVYYNAARDIVLLHDELFKRGYRALYFLREDTMNAAVNMCNVSLNQPKGNPSLILASAQETVRLIEICIKMKEDRILRCGNNDPWGYSSMCASLGVLETHLGLKTLESAKAAAAERFLSLHYKLLAYQITPYSTTHQQAQEQASQQQHQQQSGLPRDASASMAAEQMNGHKPVTTFPMDPEQMAASPFPRDGLPNMPMQWTMPHPDGAAGPSATAPSSNGTPFVNGDFDLGMLGTDLNELWGEWPDGMFS